MLTLFIPAVQTLSEKKLPVPPETTLKSTCTVPEGFVGVPLEFWVCTVIGPRHCAYPPVIVVSPSLVTEFTVREAVPKLPVWLESAE